VEEIRSLVIRSQTGDLNAYGQLVLKFQDMAYGYSYSLLGDFHLAEDAAQEAFIESYRNLGQLRDPAAFPGWFRRVVFSRCQRILRRKQPETMSLEGTLPAQDKEPSEMTAESELKDSVLAAIRSLPEPERMVTTLFYINGYSQEEIAGFLELPATTVKSRLHTSRGRLKERMMDMVKDTLRENAPTPDEMSERITFIFRLAERLEEGIPLQSSLQLLSQELKTGRLKKIVSEMQSALASPGFTIHAMFAKCPELFPPMVVALIEDGEYFGIVDQTARLAGEWLRHGRFTVDPFVYPRAFDGLLCRTLQRGIEQDAASVVINSTHQTLLPRANNAPIIWPEFEMPAGELQASDIWPIQPRLWGTIRTGLKAKTILDPEQSGDVLTGRLRIRPDPAQEERLFPIAFRYFPCGEEVRIVLAEGGHS